MEKPLTSPLNWNDPKATFRLASFERPERRAALAEKTGAVKSFLTDRRKGVERALGSLFGL